MIHSRHPDTSIQVYAVILVGGKGKRLRPLSTARLPKAFLSVTKDRKTMFRKTIARIAKIIPCDHILVVGNSSHAKLVRRDFSGAKEGQILLEPVSRNTAPAIALAALTLIDRLGDAIMVVLPTDQYIENEKVYLEVIKRGIEFAVKTSDAILVFGIRPAFPSSEFGYIKTGREEKRGIYKVRGFTEKPGPELAKRYMKNGRYLWNAGAFVFRASAILEAIRNFKPAISNKFWSLENFNRHYRKLPDISIDYAVMEKAENIYCVKGRFGWHDIGSFRSLKGMLKREGRKFIEKNGKVVKIL